MATKIIATCQVETFRSNSPKLPSGPCHRFGNFALIFHYWNMPTIQDTGLTRTNKFSFLMVFAFIITTTILRRWRVNRILITNGYFTSYNIWCALQKRERTSCSILANITIKHFNFHYFHSKPSVISF